MNTEILKQLEQIAFKKTIPFCYSCYKKCSTGKCKFCGSDDLMRLLPENGCEYGTEWVIKALLEEHLTPANIEETFEQFISNSYPETTKVGWMELDTVSVLKEMDPISWKIARDEYIDYDISEGNVLTFDNGTTYYWRNDIEDYIEAES